MRSAGRWPGNERGIALPLALMIMAFVLSLSLVFVGLARQEPTIAANHANATRAHAHSDSGLEYALWATTNSGASGALPAVPAAGATAGAPFDGSQFFRMTPVGGFHLTVAGVDANSVSVTSLGKTTVDETTTNPLAKAQLRAQYVKFPDMGLQSPCALCVRGDLELTGTTDVDGSNGGACGAKVGTWSTGATTLNGDATVNGTRTPSSPTQYKHHQAEADFDRIAPTKSQMDALRAIAKSRGTYLRPSEPGGRVTFEGVPDGVVFVDTHDTSCSSVCEPTATDTTTAVIGPGAFANASGFKGWLVVNGNMKVNGNFGGASGLTYVAGDLDVSGIGSHAGSSGSSGGDDGHADDGHADDGHADDGHSSDGVRTVTNGFAGTVIVKRTLGTTDPKMAGNATMAYDCNAIESTRPQNPGWALVLGTYKASPRSSGDGHSDGGHAEDGHAEDGHSDDGHSDGGSSGR